MPVRSSMAALIARTRLLINDPSGGSEQFADQDIQDVLDEGRADYVNEPLIAKPTFSGSTISYLDYYHPLGGWEDSTVLKQWLVNIVTPSLSEPIAGHWQFATTILPDVFLTGSLHDVYRASADLLERWAARWTLSYNVSADGQSLQRSQAVTMLLDLAHTYRRKQRAHRIMMVRTDLAANGTGHLGLGATEIDYMGKG